MPLVRAPARAPSHAWSAGRPRPSPKAAGTRPPKRHRRVARRSGGSDEVEIDTEVGSIPQVVMNGDQASVGVRDEAVPADAWTRRRRGARLRPPTPPPPSPVLPHPR